MRCYHFVISMTLNLSLAKDLVETPDLIPNPEARVRPRDGTPDPVAESKVLQPLTLKRAT
jgi:hypothetical protein